MSGGLFGNLTIALLSAGCVILSCFAVFTAVIVALVPAGFAVLIVTDDFKRGRKV